MNFVALEMIVYHLSSERFLPLHSISPPPYVFTTRPDEALYT